MRLLHHFLDSVWLAFKMRSAQKGVNVFRQHMPQHFSEERVSELVWNFGDILDLCNLQLLYNAEGMQEIPSEYERVGGCVDSVDPTARDEERVAGSQVNSCTFLDRVAKEHC